jgi:glycosyltransferase involved in cell wall biosynthesis
MRILMLTDVYPPVLGGMERHVQRLSRELVARGHDVAVATFSLPGTPELAVENGVWVHRLRGLVQSLGGLHSNIDRPFAPPLPDPKATWALRSLIRSSDWDVIHCHNWLVHSFLPLRAWCAAPLVFTLHDYSLVCAKKTMLLRGTVCTGAGVSKCLGCAVETFGAPRGLPTTIGNWSMQLPLRLGVDLFLPVSEAVARGNRLAERHLPFRVIPNFIPDATLEYSVAEDPRLSQLPDGEFLLYVGGLDRSKGVDVLLRAYAALTDAPPLVLIGATRPESLPDLPPNVLLFKDWPEAAVQGAWRRSLMGLVPSVWSEPCPTVVLEAMAAAKPVVASHIGGIPEMIVDGQTGVLVPPGDANALRQAIERLLNRPDLRASIGAAARVAVDRFTARTVVPEIERTYAQLRETTWQAA